MKVNKIFIVILVISLLSGCGKRQINELALVSAVGIDQGSSPNSVRVTVQVVRPADARGQTGAPAGGTGEPIYSVQAEGKTIFEAIRNLARFSSRRVYWAHNFIIVINEKFARAGIADMIDFFTRNPELRMNTWIAATPNPASEVVSTITGLEVVPGEAVDKLFRYNEIVSEAPRTNMTRLQESYLNEYTHPVLARLELKNRGISNKKPEEFGSLKQIELSGTAVFKHDKMVGWLNRAQSRALLLFIENVDSGIEVITCPDLPNQDATLEVKSQSLHVKPIASGSVPSFHVDVSSRVELSESGCLATFNEMRGYLEEQMGNRVKEQIESLLAAAQKKYKVDILKLGEIYENEYPSEWRRIRDDWEDIFPQVQITIDSRAELTSAVLKITKKKIPRG
ncbi:Ger(x)C family spore germination protein [Paenibacillus nanensis]|uniref:Ger(X)C family spore germination protein n=1 Tax=Paenibacillus nanensis TaxID=393251 RepID=A0A3A1UZV2_9BACL|nr:Ger(x)C family spore germination protein [Paenibacillus nanensis]RIX52971.1 Ger(x)C family spore germination protein [Paenibacillus nanensis]